MVLLALPVKIQDKSIYRQENYYKISLPRNLGRGKVSTEYYIHSNHVEPDKLIGVSKAYGKQRKGFVWKLAPHEFFEQVALPRLSVRDEYGNIMTFDKFLAFVKERSLHELDTGLD